MGSRWCSDFRTAELMLASRRARLFLARAGSGGGAIAFK
jgi:hypothetical protein